MDINFVIWTMRILQFIKWSNIVGLVLVFGFFVLMPLVNKVSVETIAGVVYVVPMIILNIAFTLVFHFTAKGLSLEKRWARYTAIGIGVLLLFVFPIGTVFGMFFLYAMLIDWPKHIVYVADDTSPDQSNLDLTPKS